MPAQPHRSDPRILSRRTLQRDHRALAELLRPGLSVLDVGCGTGAITAGIAEAVDPGGWVAGIDRDAQLLAIARYQHRALTNIRFELGDAQTLRFHAEFDIVSAARTLQWIAQPAQAILKMKQAAKPSGLICVLDYDHTRNHWEPDPPREFRNFYEAFLAWRQENGWDNAMAEHLPHLMQSGGLVDVVSVVQDEVVERGQSDFAERSALWSEVMENLRPQLIAAGFCNDADLRTTRESYDLWAQSELRKQVLVMRTVTGRVPDAMQKSSMPRDGASQHDHYIYGWPKKPENDGPVR